MSKEDSLGRRSRTHPTSTGKRITPQSRDMLWFAKLQEHGPLPSSFLLAYCKESHASSKRAQERLTELFHENNTPHQGSYLLRPPQQFKTIDSRYNQLVYDLTKSARLTLKQEGLLHPKRGNTSGPWLHKHMVACITASIELACNERDDINYIPQSAILERADADLSCKVEIADPSSKQRYSKVLIPDAVFGLEYVGVEGKRYRFFAVEADRSTEPATSSNFGRKSFQKSLLQYQAYIEREAYKKHLGLTAPMLVLNVTTSQQRMEKMLDVIARHFPSGNSYMLFQHWDDFGEVFRPPEPNCFLPKGCWHRAGFDEFKINKISPSNNVPMNKSSA